eukprot:s836_g10.t1
MPDAKTMALVDESRRLANPKDMDNSRGWHDRSLGNHFRHGKLPDGDVPEKIKKIAGWKRAMKEFMNGDPKLNDLVHLFTQKFVQMGQSRNFTLSTLLDPSMGPMWNLDRSSGPLFLVFTMDLSWTVLILTWEAVINDRLPMMDEVERGFKEKYEDLQKTLMESRRQYLAELSEHRDRMRSETLSPPLQAALAEIGEEDADHGVYRFQPEMALDPLTQEYFKGAYHCWAVSAVLLFLVTMMMRLLAAAVFTVLPVESSAANATRGLKVRREEDTVTILHVSDTHSLHYSLGDLPSADIFIHSGDVSTVGSDGEVGDFNNWLGSLKGKYREMFVISGNHDFWETNWRLNRGALSDATAQSPNYFQEKITNAKVLNHDLVEVMGLKIWGAGWAPRRGDSFSGNNYDDVPAGVDILVTHDGPVGIFDSTAGGSWGSSQQLRSAIYRSKAKVHLFGHIHEQRGHWQKEGNGGFQGHSTWLVVQITNLPPAI